MRRYHVLLTVAAIVFAGCSAGGGLAAGDVDREISFQEVASDAGLVYETRGEAVGNGDGAVLVTDYNGDHRPDVLVLGGEEPVLYENQGSGTFEPSGALPSVGRVDVRNGLFFDYDNDGDDDLLLVPKNGTMQFLENDAGEFRHRDVGLSDHLQWGTGVSVADYTGNGCLDVFVIQSGNWTTRLPTGSSGDSAARDNGNENLLYRGDCSGFERVDDAGIDGTYWSLATSFVDLTGDGYPDIHVANDFNYDVLYVNQGDGTFDRRTIPETDRNGMASEIVDVNGDARPDLFVTNIGWEKNPREIWALQSDVGMDNKGNNLLVNTGNGTFDDRAAEYGVRMGGWGWAAQFSDFDHDGDQDLVHATSQYLRQVEANGQTSYSLVETAPSLWENRGNGSFARLNRSQSGFDNAEGRGLATFDYDGDGDVDVVEGNTVGPFKLYENDGTGGNWIRIDLAGTASQTPINAEVFVTGERTQYRLYDVESNYFSQSSRTIHVGLGTVDAVDVRVVWPDGTETTYEDVDANQRVVIEIGGNLTPVGTGS